KSEAVPASGGGQSNPGSLGLNNAPLNRGLERALEEAANSGLLNLSARKLKEFPRSAMNHDLSDTVQAGKRYWVGQQDGCRDCRAGVCVCGCIYSVSVRSKCLCVYACARAPPHALFHPVGTRAHDRLTSNLARCSSSV
uniref:Uncharacterized protein n=1 Tax=Erpetoichthys calabaricus TaxID=27687 RepID=A0A8C4RWC3_ERPCA